MAQDDPAATTTELEGNEDVPPFLHRGGSVRTFQETVNVGFQRHCEARQVGVVWGVLED